LICAAPRAYNGPVGRISADAHAPHDVFCSFTIKALVKAQQHGIRQRYWFVTGESKNYDDPTADPFNLMGFYENLKRDGPGQQQLTPQGIANRTTFQQLYGWQYAAAATAALSLPAQADGAAFR
jgi:hypothetical protein